MSQGTDREKVEWKRRYTKDICEGNVGWISFIVPTWSHKV